MITQLDNMGRWLAGLTLCGWKVDGGYQLDEPFDEIITEFPKEIMAYGRVYTLEYIKDWDNGFVNAEYV